MWPGPSRSRMASYDPLDGLVTYSELQALATGEFGESSWPDLSTDIGDMADICREEKWSTDDPLGIGGLLFDAWRIAQLMVKGGFGTPDLLDGVLDSALLGLESFAADNPLKYRARQRLAFRELGLAIGLKGVGKVQGCIAGNPDLFGREGPLQRKVEALAGFVPLGQIIERFWLDEKNRETDSWTDHREINMVMLATCLVPDGFLTV